MEKENLSEANFRLWLLVGKLSHSIIVSRQKELNRYHIPVHQYHVLRVIQDLGSKAALSEVAKQVEREEHAISKQTIRMEKDGLIKRTKNNPKSNILSLELTEKGLDLLKVGRESKSIDGIFSSLSWEEHQQMESILTKVLINMKENPPD